MNARTRVSVLFEAVTSYVRASVYRSSSGMEYSQCIVFARVIQKHEAYIVPGSISTALVFRAVDI